MDPTRPDPDLALDRSAWICFNDVIRMNSYAFWG
jgi:hypothetical protein